MTKRDTHPTTERPTPMRVLTVRPTTVPRAGVGAELPPPPPPPPPERLSTAAERLGRRALEDHDLASWSAADLCTTARTLLLAQRRGGGLALEPAVRRVLDETAGQSGLAPLASRTSLLFEAAVALDAPALATAAKEALSATQTLLAEKTQRAAPGGADDVVFSEIGARGQAVSALVTSYLSVGPRSLLRDAIQTARRTWDRRPPTIDVFHQDLSKSGAEAVSVIDGYARLASGMLKLYQISSDDRHLRRARELIDHSSIVAQQPGGLLHQLLSPAVSPAATEASEVTTRDDLDGLTTVARLLRAMWVAHAITGHSTYRDTVVRILWDAAERWASGHPEQANWLELALLVRGPFFRVVISGDRERAATKRLADTYARLLPPHAVCVWVPEGGPSITSLLMAPPLTGRRAPGGQPTAFIDTLGGETITVGDPDGLRAALSTS